jgi:hypothetical protein
MYPDPKAACEPDKTEQVLPSSSVCTVLKNEKPKPWIIRKCWLTYQVDIGRLAEAESECDTLKLTTRQVLHLLVDYIVNSDQKKNKYFPVIYTSIKLTFGNLSFWK